MFQEEIRIPKERIPVLVGKEGSIRKMLERKTNTKITVDSQEGDVTIQGEESIDVYNAKNIVQIIGRGVNPLKALILLGDGIFEIMNIKDYTGKSKSRMKNLKARVIGTQGKAKATIEMLTHTEIIVFGKTITIVGKPEDVMLAKTSVERLLQGAPHGNVFIWLEKQQERHDRE